MYHSSKTCYYRDQAQLLSVIYGVRMAVLKWLIFCFSSPPLPAPLMDAHSWDQWSEKNCAVHLFTVLVHMVLLFHQGCQRKKKHNGWKFLIKLGAEAVLVTQVKSSSPCIPRKLSYQQILISSLASPLVSDSMWLSFIEHNGEASQTRRNSSHSEEVWQQQSIRG